MTNQSKPMTCMRQQSLKWIVGRAITSVVPVVALMALACSRISGITRLEYQRTATQIIQIPAQISPRSMTPDSAGGKTGPSGKQDEGLSRCPAFSHYHHLLKEWTDEGQWPLAADPKDLDGLCHDDKTDEPIKERPKLPKPRFKPDPKSTWL